jgi:hypothetical protein
MQMGDTIKSSDFECRYIREGPYGEGGFTRFVKDLGIDLPSNVSVRDAVRYRWTTPRLRIALPREYFDDWTEFPLWSRESSVRPEHSWADLAVQGDFDFGLTFPPKGRLTGDWYLHPFDTDADEVREMLEHAISPEEHPEPFTHPRGGTVYPYVDFFPYWEAYRLMESVRAAELFEPIANTPQAEEAAKGVVKNFDRYIGWSNGWLEKIRREYAFTSQAFEWVSLYRTALAASVHTQRKKPDLRSACKQLVARVGRDADTLKDELRNVLLRLWRDWHLFDRYYSARGAELHLQQDIKRAVDLIETFTQRGLDYRDPRWYVTDRNQRPWAQLHEALPFEHWLAQESFPRQAAVYLTSARQLRFRHRVPTDEASLREAMRSRWPASYGFRRFTILFKRMHDLINKDRDSLVTFTDTNPADYMILGCLVVERMVTEWWRRKNPSAAKLPSFDIMLEGLADELTTLLKCKPVATLLVQHKDSAKLHALGPSDRLPLQPPARSARQFVFRTLHNLRILRNYSAHHDCLDFELSFGREGHRAVKAIVGSVALILSLPP